jgi:hypothetical protein
MEAAVNNRDWNRIESELGFLLAAIPGDQRKRAINVNIKRVKTPEIDTESILQHIEEALQEYLDEL